jgi:hypothetical protein
MTYPNRKHLCNSGKKNEHPSRLGRLRHVCKGRYKTAPGPFDAIVHKLQLLLRPWHSTSLITSEHIIGREGRAYEADTWVIPL